ncbi:MDR family MFS transporter [Sporobolomyces koalae]|uniref:MDR family MFS transporter n=1 Tax=Sporobolomyces koalae TaxID=500713 RepID=UPI003179EC2F
MSRRESVDDAPAGNLIDGTPILPAAATDREKVEDEIEQGGSLNKGLSSESDTIVVKKNKLDDVHVLPKNNLPMVLLGLALCVLLAALDSTIVSTALSTIQRDLNGSSASLTWITQAYLLLCTCLAPSYGKLSQLYGRKAILFSSIAFFLLGSTLCATAKNMIWLCASRGVQGIGGGGIVQMTQVVISDITPLHSRGKYTSVIGSTWGLASACGPLLGGAFVSKATWRWCFWINLPVGAFAFAVLAYFLKLNPHTPPSTRELISDFDFLGLFLMIVGLVVLLFGFSFGETNWSSVNTIVCLTVGCAVLAGAVFVELTTKRSAIIPPRLFKTRTSAATLVGTFFQSFCFMSVSYYMPLFFQVLGSTPLMSGVRVMPFSVGSSVVSIAAGFYVAKTRRYKPIMLVSYLIMSLGFALLATLDERSNTAQQVLYLMVIALGCGPLFQSPYIAIQSCMPVADMATATATVSLIRQIGCTVGIAVSGAMYGSKLRAMLNEIGYTLPPGLEGSAVGNVNGLQNIQPPELSNRVVHAYARALSDAWIICAPLLFAGFLVSFALKQYSLDRTTVQSQAGGQKPVVQGDDDDVEDKEKGSDKNV